MDKRYNVSKKAANGRWVNHGNVGPNKWGNIALGLKITAELKEMIANEQEGGWVNFSLFEKKDKEAGEPDPW